MGTPIIKEEIIVSERWHLTKEDVLKWFSNQVKFLKPLGIFIALLYIGFVIPRVKQDGIALTDFVPTNEVLTSIALYILNALYDLFTKLSSETHYTKPTE